MSHAWLPELLAEIAEAAGLDAALRLAAAHGGTRKRIPASADDDHWLVTCVGRIAADKICAHFRQGEEPRGVYLDIPHGKTASARQRMIEALTRGASASEAARASGMTERTAYRSRRRLRVRQNEKQGRLF